MRRGFRTRILNPFAEFIRLESSSGLVLLLAALVALIWANSPGAAGFEAFWVTKTPVHLGLFHLPADIRMWVNDAGMALFFFLVGLEIKREFLDGHLKDPKDAALPIFGALGGMIVPAGVYLACQAGGPGRSGWGIPMATDIAFALGALAVLGSRVPPALKVFLATLAIVDDLGAVLVIALFYSGGVQMAYFAGAIGWLVVIAVCSGWIRRSWWFLVLGVPLWLLIHQSGLHATIAGVLLAFVIPLRSIPRLEIRLHPWVTYGIIPVFALANAGVAVGAVSPETQRIGLGVLAGLVVGKPIGIVGGAWLAIRVRLAQRGEGITWTHLWGTGILGGIGFTMSLFIGALALADPAQVQAAKVATLAASFLAAIIGLLFLALSAQPGVPDPAKR